MCANAELQRLLLAELRQELAARKAARSTAAGPRPRRVVAYTLAAPVICVGLAVVVFIL